MAEKITINGRPIRKDKITVDNCKTGFQLVIDDTSLLTTEDIDYLSDFLRKTHAAANKVVVTFEELHEVIIQPS